MKRRKPILIHIDTYIMDEVNVRLSSEQLLCIGRQKDECQRKWKKFTRALTLLESNVARLTSTQLSLGDSYH